MARKLIHWRGGFPSTSFDIQTDFDGLMQRFFGDCCEESREMCDSFSPGIDIAETDKAYEVIVELPGINPDEVKVELREGELSISGEKKEENETQEKTFHRLERRWGTFQRLISLPGEVERDQIDAQYKNGVLTVTLPKSEKVLPKTIEVKVGH